MTLPFTACECCWVLKMVSGYLMVFRIILMGEEEGGYLNAMVWVEVRGKLAGVSSLNLLCGPWGKSWHQVPIPFEPSCWP